MRVSAFLAELRGRGIQVWADGDRLRCNGPAGLLTPDLRGELQQRKDDILEFLRSADELARQQRAIVPLQPRGNRTPIFASPGHNGDVFCYRALARYLGDDQPLYGLQPPGLDGDSAPLDRIEDLAAFFAAQIRAFLPDGPCILAGYCAGGMIAFELGRLLRREGRVIPFLALFGAPYPSRYRRLTMLRERLGQKAERVVQHTRALASRSFGEWPSYVAERRRHREAYQAEQRAAAAEPGLVLRGKVERATIAAGRRYTPGPFEGRVCVFVPSGDWVRSIDEPLRWRSVARDSEVYVGPEGRDFSTMLLEPHAATFADLFRTAALRASRLVSVVTLAAVLGCGASSPWERAPAPVAGLPSAPASCPIEPDGDPWPGTKRSSSSR